MYARPQHTLKEEVSFSGVGIHTGKEVTLRFCPAPENTGLVFQRIDLPGFPQIVADVDAVQQTARCTTLGTEAGCVHTVEHVLSALSAYQIDNLYIQLTDAEPPVADGSARVFVKMIEQAGIAVQEAVQPYRMLTAPVYFSHKDVHLVALPSSELRLSYTLHYPHVPLIKSQFYSFVVTPQGFKDEIAPSRTFALHSEIEFLLEQGLIRGGTLENAVVIKDAMVLSKEGLRFPDEMVRHKLLDLLGDLKLIPPFLGHVIALCSGHAANVAFGKVLKHHFSQSVCVS